MAYTAYTDAWGHTDGNMLISCNFTCPYRQCLSGMLRIPGPPLKRARPHAAALADTPLVDVQVNAELWDRPAPDHPWPRHTITATEPLPSHLRGVHAHEQAARLPCSGHSRLCSTADHRPATNRSQSARAGLHALSRHCSCGPEPRSYLGTWLSEQQEVAYDVPVWHRHPMPTQE